MLVWLPITCAQTMHTASGITGLTLPGMIELPGCNAGSAISPRPAKGPEFIQRKSLLIFISAQAKVFNWRSEEHTSELQSLMRNSYAVFCLKKKKRQDHAQ